MEKLFNKPSWLKPEINEFIYYPHILILIFVAGSVMKFIFNFDSLIIAVNWIVILKLLVALTIGDMAAHTILKLN